MKKYKLFTATQTGSTSLLNHIVLASIMQTGAGGMVEFIRPANKWPLAKELDMDTFYAAGETGYTDYPASQDKTVTA